MPTIASMNSAAESEKNGTPASPATARASSVLPVPGGPESSTPRGIRAPSFWYLVGLLQEVHDLLQLGLGVVDAGHVGEGHGLLRALDALGTRAPELARARRRHRPLPPLAGRTRRTAPPAGWSGRS